MPQQEYPSLNDMAPSWADLTTRFSVYEGAVLDMADIAALKWGRKVDVAAQRGTGGIKRKRTTGQGDYEASLTLYRDAHEKLCEVLAEKAPQRGNRYRISLVPFDIFVNYSLPVGDRIYRVKILGARIVGDSDDAKEGPEAGQLEIPLDVMEIVNTLPNGKEIVLV